METLNRLFVVSFVVIGLLATAALAKPAGVLLQEGLYAEEVEGDIDAAIKAYQQIIDDPSAQRSHVAQAMYRQGMCYLKKKDEQKAKAIFEQIIQQYADQPSLIEKVAPLLADLTTFDPAALMPPETLVYMEIGSPGKQVETILNMLKGTPLENPLAVISGVPGPVGPGGQSPGDIMAGLLNPSMMAEFKKIRGMGVGVMGITNEVPPAIIVMFPGKSDALRGIIIAALGMIGRPTDPIEGMQAVTFSDGGGVIYDDTVIIAASPSANAAAHLQWCAKQYKGLMRNPSLASSNKSFAKLSKKARHQNALTIWANVDRVYTELIKQFPEGKTPKEMFMANGFMDFGNIDDLISFLSIEENGIVCQTEISFVDGHNCLAYNLIRTPNLTRGGFEAVPSDAVALVSQAFGEPDGAQAEAVRQKIQHVTGLDIGREIYANIEQLNLFAVPADKTSQGGVPFFPGCLGVAITSHNPQQTRQILTTLLGAIGLLTGDQQAGQEDTAAGKYQIGIAGDQKLYCYMDQVNKTTVLSLNRAITEACITAIKERRSVCDAGPLKDAVNKLSPTTSKLILVNVGGALRLASPAIIEPFKDAQRDSLEEALAQLAQANDQAVIEFSTDEQLNNFRLYAGINNLPPINEVFGPALVVSQIFSQAKAEVKAAHRLALVPATIIAATQPPVIDGNAEGLWSDAREYKIGNVTYSPVLSDEDLSAYYKAMWDEENLYVFIDVTDDKLMSDSSSDEFYLDDCVEVFIDADNSKSGSYDENDGQYHFDWNRGNPTMGSFQHGRTDNIEFALVAKEKGYRTEIKFPWSTLGVKPSAGAKIGLDVHVNDDDDGGDRETKLMWRDKEDNAWQSPQVFGTAELAGLLGWWKFDEAEGSNASDSSGNNHNGILMGNPVWRPSGGKFGGALEFDGQGDYVELADESDFDIAGQITVSAWVNIRSVPSAWTAIITKGDSAWRLSTMEAERAFHFAVSGSTVLNGQTRVSADEWHHVVGIYDGKEIRIYVDGRVDVSMPWDRGIETNDYPVLIGENAGQTERFWHGLIDDVRIFNYALTEDEIAALSRK